MGGIRRPDFRQVSPTLEELTAWRRKHPRQAPPYRAECKSCGQRIWYSGIGIGAHLRSKRHNDSLHQGCRKDTE